MRTITKLNNFTTELHAIKLNAYLMNQTYGLALFLETSQVPGPLCIISGTLPGPGPRAVKGQGSGKTQDYPCAF